MIIVTGSGRSGTSFLCKVLMRCGCHFRGGWDEKIKAGLEDPLIVHFNEELFKNYGLNTVTDFLSDEQVAELAYKYKIPLKKCAQQINFVKDPRFCKTLEVWLKAGAKVEFVIVCLRNISSVVKSAIDYSGEEVNSLELAKSWHNQILARLGTLFNILYQYEVNFQPIIFPKDYLASLESSNLSPNLQSLAKRLDIEQKILKKAIKQEFRPEMIKFL
ncbi:hypothetical protein KFV02_03645 [Desulfohalobiaceae bacterium Ax17]|uniref:hypothetical protein n=1 Tax=Desulfovulcanus ferrireducens TaxID=2831190 RepID=UPI00207BC142|nr:hypothetical protein [Desulfovulcanus ferrireducens]MBT8763020.1 hypothetical protein [Desulfovulcanus ferrireducens]